MSTKLRLDVEPSLVDLPTAAAVFSVGPDEFWKGVKAGDYPPPVNFRGGRRWRLMDLRKHADALPTVDPSEPIGGRGKRVAS